MRSCPLPKRFLSLIPIFANGPSWDENPAPRDISPVDFSSTDTFITVLSGELPARLSTLAFEKNPRFLILRRALLNFDTLNASPSNKSNSRLMTSSKVREFPSILILSTKTRGVLAIYRESSTELSSFFRLIFRFTSTKAKPSAPNLLTRLSITLLIERALYHFPSNSLYRYVNLSNLIFWIALFNVISFNL